MASGTETTMASVIPSSDTCSAPASPLTEAQRESGRHRDAAQGIRADLGRSAGRRNPGFIYEALDGEAERRGPDARVGAGDEFSDFLHRIHEHRGVRGHTVLDGEREHRGDLSPAVREAVAIGDADTAGGRDPRCGELHADRGAHDIERIVRHREVAVRMTGEHVATVTRDRVRCGGGREDPGVVEIALGVDEHVAGAQRRAVRLHGVDAHNEVTTTWEEVLRLRFGTDFEGREARRDRHDGEDGEHRVARARGTWPVIR